MGCEIKYTRHSFKNGESHAGYLSMQHSFEKEPFDSNIKLAAVQSILCVVFPPYVYFARSTFSMVYEHVGNQGILLSKLISARKGNIRYLGSVLKIECRIFTYCPSCHQLCLNTKYKTQMESFPAIKRA